MRIWGDAWPEVWFDQSYFSRLLFFFGGTLIIVAFGISHDLLSRRRLHPVYIFGAPGLVAVYMVAIWLYDSPVWAQFSRPFLAA